MIETELKKGIELNEGDLFYMSETPAPSERVLTLLEVEEEFPSGSAVTPHPHRVIKVPGTSTPKPGRPMLLFDKTWYAVPVERPEAEDPEECLADLVRAAASEMASRACRGSTQDMRDFLLYVAGWSPDQIKKAISRDT